MATDHVNPSTLFPSLQHGFSQVVVGTGRRSVFISGQTAWDASKQIVGRTLDEQARQALRNVKAAIEAAGGSLSDLTSLRIYIVDSEMKNISAIGNASKDAFPASPPASTWIGVASLAVPD